MIFNWFKSKKVKLTPEQEILISEQVKDIKKIMSIEEDNIKIENETIKNKWVLNEKTCELCKSTNVVNKIISTVKSSMKQPTFTFQSPTYDTYSIKEEINHCNECGNEWIKRYWYNRYTFKNLKKPYYDMFIENLKYPSLEREFFKQYSNFYLEAMVNVIGNKQALQKIFKSINELK